MLHDKLREKGVPAGLKADSDAPTREKTGVHVAVGGAVVDVGNEDDFVICTDEVLVDEVVYISMKHVQAELARDTTLPVHWVTKFGRLVVAVTVDFVKVAQKEYAIGPPSWPKSARRQLSWLQPAATRLTSARKATVNFGIILVCRQGWKR